jgi:hypothetical protein
MPVRRGTTLILVGITAILLLALIFVVPARINVDRYRTQLISYLPEETGKQVEIGRLALTFFPVTTRIDHIGVKNPPIFPAGYVRLPYCSFIIIEAMMCRPRNFNPPLWNVSQRI